MTVLIYVDTSKQVGDVDHLKVFANVDAAETWFEENDPEGVALSMRSWNEARQRCSKKNPAGVNWRARNRYAIPKPISVLNGIDAHVSEGRSRPRTIGCDHLSKFPSVRLESRASLQLPSRAAAGSPRCGPSL